MTDNPVAHPHPHDGGGGGVGLSGGSLTHKLGPLPVWAWGLIGGGIFGVAYYLHKKKQVAAGSTGPSYSDLNASGNGGNAGELATTGGSAGAGGGTPPSLASWAANVVNWLIGQGTDPASASNAISAYINGQTLTSDQTVLVNKGLTQFGSPPSGILPVNTVTDNPSPTPTPTPTPPGPVDLSQTAFQQGAGAVLWQQYQSNQTPSNLHLWQQAYNAWYAAGGGAAVPSSFTPTGDAVAPTAAAPRTYTVQPGDNLSAISQRFYGNANRYTDIYNANQGVIGPNPSLIHPGQVLTIPG